MSAELNLTPEVPDRVELPAWVDPAGLAHPESFEAIRAEAARLEVAFIAAARQVVEVLRGFAVVRSATYSATNPYAHDNEAPDVPVAVCDAVDAAVGVPRLDELEGWLTGAIGEGTPLPKNRVELSKRIGYLVDWDQELRAASHLLAGVATVAGSVQ